MNRAPSFDDVFAVMAGASLGDDVRVELPAEPQPDDLATKLALALNVLLDDLSQRKAELEASEARYRALFAACPSPMWVAEPLSLRLLAVNDALCRLLGYREEELLQMTVGDLGPPEDVSALITTLGNALVPNHTIVVR